MNRKITGLLLAALFALPAPLAAQNSAVFEFVALGDMPYNIPADYEKFDRLIDRVNAISPSFTLHVGDVISGATACSDENFTKVKTQFDRFAGALVYTPGDNDWTDCRRLLMGRYDPLERLAFVRRLFFPDPTRSLGRAPVDVESQPQVMGADFASYIENVRFRKNDVLFAAAHVVGSMNNYRPDNPAAAAEYQARDTANIAWINAAFQIARETSARGLVLFWQANVHATPRRDPMAPFAMPFHNTIEAVERGAAAFRRPVLVIYGDYHFFELRPFENLKRAALPNVMRLQVFGDRHVHAVRVRVDPASAALFDITPLIVPENGVP